MPETVRYRIDCARSRFVVRAFAGGLLYALGHSPTIRIQGFDGEVVLMPGSLGSASLRMSIKANSLFVEDDITEKDRTEIERQMRDDVLETSEFPNITFESSRI